MLITQTSKHPSKAPFHRRLALIGTVISASFLLMSCDQQDTRLDRAKDIVQATTDQLSGRDVQKVTPGKTVTMESVDVADRAIAGTILPAGTDDDYTRKARFAVGSIVAKPRNISDVAMVDEIVADIPDDAAEEAYVEEVIVVDEPSDDTPPPSTRSVAIAPGAPRPVEVVEAPIAPMAMPRIKIDSSSSEATQASIRKARQEMRAQRRATQLEGLEDGKTMRVRDLKRLKGKRGLKSGAPVPPEPQKSIARPRPGAAPDLVVVEPFESAPPNSRSLEVVDASPEVKKLARRAAITEEAIDAQTDEVQEIVDTMAKYGLDCEVALSRDGHMVIELDSIVPTRFSPQGEPDGSSAGPADGPLSFIAEENDADCSNAGAAQVQSSAALATECVIEDLKASGQFEYVEKDYIFENQFARWPGRNPPPISAPGDTTTPADPNAPADSNTADSNATDTNDVTESDVADTGDTATPSPQPTPTPVNFTPNDPLWSLQWNFLNNGSGEGESPGGSGFETFWATQQITGSSDVVVAVVDTGLQMNHPDIVNSPNIYPGWDMVSDPRMGNDGDGRDSDADDPGDLCDPNDAFASDSFHGTHVAGTVGAVSTDNGSGVAGGAWDVKIVPVRALGKCGGRLSDINDAIRWAGGLIPSIDADGSEVWNENPADIINLSIGLFEFCPASMQDAIDAVVERGVIVVAAAGNARVPTEFYAPAGCRNVITVAAGDARGQIAPYSNFGSEVDVLAPGGDLFRDDNQDGRPDGILSTKAASNCYDPVTGEAVDSCHYAYEQGTSMAAPHVSAAFALLKVRFPEATAIELEATLLNNVDPRTQGQCAGDCNLYPDTEEIPGLAGMCYRPCGGGLLNLSNIPAPSDDAMNGGSDQ